MGDPPPLTGPANRGRFGFVVLEVPWPLGPRDGRYSLRDGPGAAGITQVVVIATLGAVRRGRAAHLRSRGGRGRRLEQDPGSPPVSIGRATVISVRTPLPDADAARAWLSAAGDAELDDALRALGRLLHAQRLATADPALAPVTRARLLTARAGWGHGDALAAGRWTELRELIAPDGGPGPGGVGGPGAGDAPGGSGGGRGTRRRSSAAEGRLAALLAGRQAPLACEELALRARCDIDEDRPREAALQLLVALDAALAELPGDPGSAALDPRLAELRERRAGVAAAAQQALAGMPSPESRAHVADALSRLQAALRARGAAAG